MDSAGLSEADLLDIRGNQDAWDNLRGGMADYYSTYSARGSRMAAGTGGGEGSSSSQDGGGRVRGGVGEGVGGAIAPTR